MTTLTGSQQKSIGAAQEENMDTAQEDGTCTMYVFSDMRTVRATLEMCKEDCVSLMQKDLLVAHWDAILATAMYEGLCSYMQVPMSGNPELDRLLVMEACSSSEETHLCPRGYKRVDTGEKFAVYYHVTSDLLGILGAEYPLVVYMLLLTESIDPACTIYVSCSKGIATALRVKP